MEKVVEFRDNADEVLHLLDTAIGRALFDIGVTAQGYTKDNTPVRTGNLRDSWAVQIHQNENYLLIGTDIEYGKYVENGSRTNKAQHMLQKAVSEHTDEYKRLAKEALDNA